MSTFSVRRSRPPAPASSPVTLCRGRFSLSARGRLTPPTARGQAPCSTQLLPRSASLDLRHRRQAPHCLPAAPVSLSSADCRQGRSLSTTGVAGGRRPPHQAPVSPLRKPAPRRARSLGGGSVCRSDAARSVGLPLRPFHAACGGRRRGGSFRPGIKFRSPFGRLTAAPTGQGTGPHPQGSRFRRPPFWAPASPPWEPASTVTCSFRDLRWASGPSALTARFAGSAPEGGVPSARWLIACLLGSGQP